MNDKKRETPGSLRIIGGEWRGRRLKIPPGTEVRPTPDRVRETLFNWLHGRLHGARCLDLFAGSGSLGFEALSRGATDAWFVERDRRLADALAAHVQMLGAQARVVRSDAAAFIESTVTTIESTATTLFDVAFVDPPYERPVEPLLVALFPLLAPAAWVYVERPMRPGLPDVPGAEWVKRSHAASVEFGLLQRI